MLLTILPTISVRGAINKQDGNKTQNVRVERRGDALRRTHAVFFAIRVERMIRVERIGDALRASSERRNYALLAIRAHDMR